jgi:hypothetical protein
MRNERSWQGRKGAGLGGGRGAERGEGGGGRSGGGGGGKGGGLKPEGTWSLGVASETLVQGS